MRKLFRKKRKCTHKNKTELKKDYFEAYIIYQCNDCGHLFYEDMYND